MRAALFMALLLYPATCSAQMWWQQPPPCPEAPKRQAEAKPERHKPMTVLVALDDSFESQLLKAELTRDWLKPNRGDRNYLRQLQALSNGLRRDFRFNFDTDTPSGLHCPAIKVGCGPWEVLDRRIFRYSTLPLRSLCWYRDATFLESQGDWEYICPDGDYSHAYHCWKPKIPQAPWLPQGEFPKVSGIVSTSDTHPEYDDEHDNGP
jgi:hypothetical protein